MSTISSFICSAWVHISYVASTSTFKYVTESWSTHATSIDDKDHLWRSLLVQCVLPFWGFSSKLKDPCGIQTASEIEVISKNIIHIPSILHWFHYIPWISPKSKSQSLRVEDTLRGWRRRRHAATTPAKVPEGPLAMSPTTRSDGHFLSNLGIISHRQCDIVYVYMCMYIYIYAYTHMITYIYIYTYDNIHIYIYTYDNIHIYIHIITYIHIYIYSHIW